MVFISLEKIIIFGLWIVYLGLVQRNSIVFPQSLYVLYHINTFVWNHGWGFVSYKISPSSHYLSKYCTHISRHLNLLSLKYILVFISINVNKLLPDSFITPPRKNGFSCRSMFGHFVLYRHSTYNVEAAIFSLTKVLQLCY